MSNGIDFIAETPPGMTTPTRHRIVDLRPAARRRDAPDNQAATTTYGS